MLSTIPTVKRFKYLGSAVQENGSSCLEIERKMVKQKELLAH
jgi:hypothetical protein